MFMLAAYVFICTLLIYGVLRIFLDEYTAKDVLLDIGQFIILMFLTMVAGVVWRMFFPGGDAWGRAILEDSSWLGVWKWYEGVETALGPEHRYLVFGRPVIAFVQFVVTYFNVLVFHFTPIFLITHAIIPMVLYLRIRQYAAGLRGL